MLKEKAKQGKFGLDTKEYKTDYKTINSLTDIPVIYAFISTINVHFDRFRYSKNLLIRTITSLIILSVSKMLYFVAPILKLLEMPSN